MTKSGYLSRFHPSFVCAQNTFVESSVETKSCGDLLLIYDPFFSDRESG